MCQQWRIMPVTLQRLVAIHTLLTQEPQTGPKRAFFLGSSVLFEGIDCSVIDDNRSDDRKSFNIAWTGSDPLQWFLILPALIKADPHEAVLFVDLIAMTRVRPIPDNLLAVAAWWQFIPADRLKDFKTYLTEHEYSILSSSSLQQLIAFRSFLPGALDGYVREISRKDLRYEGHVTNFKSPWVMKKTINEQKMQHAIITLQNNLNNRSVNSDQLRILTYVVSTLRNKGIKVRLVLTPVNPAIEAPVREPLVDDVSKALCAVAEKNGAEFIDCSGILQSSQFADDVHPAEPGREVWSKFMSVKLSKN
jgi:hypothetical protein